MKKIWFYLVLGIIIRILISITTFHPDIQSFNLAGYLISSGNILNLYDYLPHLSDSNPLKNIAVFNYPPAIYLYHGIFNFLFSNILKMSFINDFLLDSVENYGNIFFNLHLLLLKLPYLIFDLLIVFLLCKLFNSEKEIKLAVILWMFNPINLYATYMMGQFDIIPTFFIVLSLYFSFKNKLALAALALGGGIAFKIFPVFLIIPLIFLGKNFLNKIKLLFLSLLPYFLSIIPFINSSNFRSTALVASQSDKSLYASLPVSGGEVILLFPASLVFFYLLISNKVDKSFLWRLYLIPLLLFFIFTHFHPQWLIWIAPFLVIDLVIEGYKNLLAILLILGSWLGSLFFFDPSLTLGLFVPIFPILHNTPSVWSLLNLNLDYNFFRSFLQTIFAGASAFLIYYHFSKKNAK